MTKKKVNAAFLVSPTDVDDVRLKPSEAAALFQISKSMITKLKNAGRLKFDADGTAPKSRIAAEYEIYKANMRPRVDRVAEVGKTVAFYAARTRRETTAARREELALMRDEGTVIEVSAVARLWFATGRRLRDLVLAVAERAPAEVLAAVRAEPDDARAVAAISRILDKFLRTALSPLDKQP